LLADVVLSGSLRLVDSSNFVSASGGRWAAAVYACVRACVACLCVWGGAGAGARDGHSKETIKRGRGSHGTTVAFAR
jgi:hypothetical protein